MRKVLAILVSFAVIFAMIPTMAFADTPITLTNENVSLESSSIVYTGSSVDPVVIVAGEKLVKGTDYDVVYKIKDATDSCTPSEVNTYEAAITGKAGYTGNVTKVFSITQKDASGFAVSIPAKAVGSEFDTSGVVIKYGNIELKDTAPDDYDISFTGPVAAGTNNATITYKGNYTGSRNVTFEGKYDLASCYRFSDANSAKSYDYAKGVKRTTSFKIEKVNASDSSIPALTTADYKIEYIDNENVTTGAGIAARITAADNSKFMGSVAVTTNMKIVKRSIASTGISIAVETSSASNVIPKVTIKDGGQLLEEGANKDYTVELVSGKENTIKITGQNNYKDSVEKTFKVGKAITGVSMASSSFVYNGAVQKPSISVVAGDVTVPSTGYRVDWETDATKVGVHTFTVTGIGEYSGSFKKTYWITAKDVSKLDISISGTSFKYTGQYIKPTITVRDGSKILTEGPTKDYSLEYNSNVAPGAATVTVRMNGNYSGSKPMTFYIGKNPMTDLTVTLDKDSYNYTGSAILPKVTVKKGTSTVSSAYYTVEYSNNKAVGTGTVTIIGKSEYYGTITKSFSIIGKTVANCTVTLSQTKYDADGTAKEPAVTVKDGIVTLVKGTDYTVTYANNKTAGQASVTITGKGAYGGTKTEYFTITGKYQYIEVDQDTYTKYPTSSPFKLAPTCNGDGTGFTFTSSDSSVASVAADGTVTLKAPGKAVITIATKGDVKYTPASETVTITVKPNKGSLAKLGTPAKRSLRVYINKRAGVDGYQVRYTRGTGYKYFTAKHVTSVYKTQYRTVRYLKSGYTYKVQVRAYKILDDGTKLYGSWSTAKSLKVK